MLNATIWRMNRHNFLGSTLGKSILAQRMGLISDATEWETIPLEQAMVMVAARVKKDA